MKNKRFLLLLAVFLCGFTPSSAVAQTPLNQIRIDQCAPGDPLNTLVENERRIGLVLDARPFSIDQATGKIRFDGKTGRVSVVHMNPFVYQYTISVAQEELVSSALSDFIDILLPQALRSIGKVKSLEEGSIATVLIPANLEAIKNRLEAFSVANCTNATDDGCVALKTMKAEFDQIHTDVLNQKFGALTGTPPSEISQGTDLINGLRDEQADAYTTCSRAQNVNNVLTSYDPAGRIDELAGIQKELDDVTAIAQDLKGLVDEYFKDDTLKTYTVRCLGFNCARQFQSYAEAVLNLLNTQYKPILDNRLQIWRQFQAMVELTEKMKGKDGIFARTFEIKKKFELSAATISIKRTKVKPDDEANRSVVARNSAPPKRDAAAQNGNAKRVEQTANNARDDEEEEPEKPKPVAPDINESIQIGRPRFLVSGGLVYSPLDRQTFVSATSFTHDAQGNPTGDGNAQIVGFGENSPRRLLPMVFLNSRIASFSPASIYFSLGVTAKKDKDIDVEYLLGPSVSMLNDRAMVTFGAYAGKSQQLVPDVKIGDTIPDDAGNALLATKRYTWKPGFSFSYVFSNVAKRSQEGGGSGGGEGGSGSVADDLKDEIRIGSIPFNLAMGLAYTSLEDRTFAPVLGFARDRQGELANGQTLTRIVGLSTSSSYRLVPLAMLHSRLLNFGRYSFYLTSGVTGKKDDDKVEIEYLLGGSVNLYRRKFFFTFGTFAGKQQVLAGDLFLGGKLNSGDPGIERRYIWKPAFAFSYDISKIMPGGTKN